MNNVIINFHGMWWNGNYEYISQNIDVHSLSDDELKVLIQNISNLEILREFRQKLGMEKYVEIQSLVQIHSEIDSCGNPMVLYEMSEGDNRHIILEVICPSTYRKYHIYPPNQESKTCSEAKNSTFSKKIKYRHGDVGLSLQKNDNTNFEIET